MADVGYFDSFLPVREGVSLLSVVASVVCWFPPCTGGCIISKLFGSAQRVSFLPVREGVSRTTQETGQGDCVSSLYGRVYRLDDLFAGIQYRFLPVREGVSLKLELVGKQFKFPPCMGGCIEVTVENLQLIIVSSLHGRVYR